MRKNTMHINAIKTRLHACHHHDSRCLSDLKCLLEKIVMEHDMDAIISYRIKNAHSMKLKMRKKQCQFHEIYDRLGMRIIVKEIKDCYKVLSLCKKNSLYELDSLKDYISSPKPNGYQSLHILIKPPCSSHHQHVELQIRTWTMQQQCSLGELSHSNYKKGKYGDLSI